MRSRWIIGAIACFVFAWLIIPGENEFFKNGEFDAGPMVQLGDADGRTSLMIVWRTSELSDSRVDYGISGEYVFSVYKPEDVHRHAVLLSGLLPGTEYRYRAMSGKRVIGSDSFRTFPAGGLIRFAFFGDSGSGSAAQYDVAARILEENPDFILHTGDLIYAKGEDANYPKQFYRPYQKLIASRIFFPSLGNHDYVESGGRAWLDNFYLPGVERFYSFDCGNVHLVALDSNFVDSRSADWLESDLSKTDKLWKIVFFHHPPFTNKSGRQDSYKIAHFWLPIFKKYKVDLVLCGHDHLYTRFRPVDGVHYIVEGLGGKSRYKIKPDSRVAFTDNRDYGFGLVEIWGNDLYFSHITRSGKVLDSLAIEK